ncbi:hypothetical protein BYT27DRAFT_6838541 [Phlegmacium glaucopus]|nr:hypothetical protein BYT27DRAFT_6838541 [Phlegmacium glaucopus]
MLLTLMSLTFIDIRATSDLGRNTSTKQTQATSAIGLYLSIPIGVEIIYSAIPQIPSLQEPLKSQVQHAFVQRLQPIWKVLAGLSGVGLLTTFLMGRNASSFCDR